MNSNISIKLDYGNCEVVRLGGEEAYVKDMSPRTGTVYKADNVDELAQHSEVYCSTLEVKTGVVYRNNMLLPGEALLIGNPQSFKQLKWGNARRQVTVFGVSKESAESIVVQELRAWSSCRRVTCPAKNQETRIG